MPIYSATGLESTLSVRMKSQGVSQQEEALSAGIQYSECRGFPGYVLHVRGTHNAYVAEHTIARDMLRLILVDVDVSKFNLLSLWD